MMRRAGTTALMLAAGLACSTPASAAETVTYTYDARGRLIKVFVDRPSGTANDIQACYKYDKAGNRTQVKIDVGSQPACPN